jgi:hypothetical protein
MHESKDRGSRTNSQSERQSSRDGEHGSSAQSAERVSHILEQAFDHTMQLRIFKLRVCRLWHSVLVRRSQRAQMRWERLTPVLNRWIPPPRVLHPYPDARFYATHPS